MRIFLTKEKIYEFIIFFLILGVFQIVNPNLSNYWYFIIAIAIECVQQIISYILKQKNKRI